MKDKKNKVLGILLTLWGVLFFLYKMFFPKSVYSLLGSKALQYSSEQITKYKESLQNLYTTINILFVVLLVIILIITIIRLRKDNINPLTNNSVLLIITGLVFHIIGLVGISWMFIIISGLILINNKP